MIPINWSVFVEGWNWVITVATAVAGGVLTIAVGKFRGRMKRLRWSANYLEVATASEHAQVGKIQVLYNGVEMPRLHAGFIEVQNESSADLTNLVLTFVVNPVFMMLYTSGIQEGAVEQLKFSPEHEERVNAANSLAATGNLPEAEREYLVTRASFSIPVLNRGSKASFEFLLGSVAEATPFFQLSCLHQGVIVRYQDRTRVVWGVPFETLRWVGSVAGLAAAVVVGAWIGPPVWSAVCGWLFGWLTLQLGFVVVRAGRGIAKLFS